MGARVSIQRPLERRVVSQLQAPASAASLGSRRSSSTWRPRASSSRRARSRSIRSGS